MISLGFLALGAFIGGIVGVFLVNTEDWGDPVKGLTAVLAAAVSGAPVALARFILGDAGLAATMAMYPIGLVLGIMSPYLKFAAANWTSEDGKGTFLGLMHFLGYFALLLFGLSVFIAPARMTEYFGTIDRHFGEITRQFEP